MQTREYAGDAISEPRSHPWRGAVDDPNARYYDLKASPALIRTSLEDLRPWSRYAAIETFYALLERINHPRSALESNDCEFTGPHASEPPSERGAWECSGRIMILFRELTHNTLAGRVERLKNELHGVLGALDPSFTLGTIGTTLVSARFLALPEADDQQLGSQLSIAFWAWGKSEADTMSSLARTLTNLGHALRKVSFT